MFDFVGFDTFVLSFFFRKPCEIIVALDRDSVVIALLNIFYSIRREPISNRIVCR